MREFGLKKSGKLLISIAAIMLLMATLLVFSASAAVTIDSSADTQLGETATIEASGASGNEQVTLLVYLNTPDDENILYIDQKAATEGTVTFTFPVPDSKPEGTYTVLVGSESSDTAASATLLVGEGGGQDPDATVESIAISAQPKATYYVGDEFDKSIGSILVTYSDESTATVAFSDAKVSFAGFDSSAVAATQTITVTYTEADSEPATVTYDVAIIAAPVDEVTGIAVSDAQTLYYVGDSFNLTQGVITVSHSLSSDTTVDFDEVGVVIKVDGVTVTSGFTFDTEGTKTVTVEYEGFNDSYDVTVETVGTGDEVTGINMTTTDVKIYGTKTYQLNASVVPSSAANKTIKYVSLNTGVATVDATGLVTGVAPGTAKIVAVTADGGFVKVANVTVNHADEVTSGIRLQIIDLANSQPIAGASVSINRTGSPAANYTAVTDSEGYVTFDGIAPTANGMLPVNKFGITITAPGYAKRDIAASSSFAITSAAPTPANVSATVGKDNILMIAATNKYDLTDDGIVDDADVVAVKANFSAAPDFGIN